MWSRIRHRRLQALSLLTLAALLTTSLCLGPLYQRAMEQALSGSVLAQASPEQASIRLTSGERSLDDLEREVPEGLSRHLTAPARSLSVPVSVSPPDGGKVATRLYAVQDACVRLDVVAGECSDQAGEVMVSTADVEANGWAVGSTATVRERLDPVAYPEQSKATVTVVGVYEPAGDGRWLDAPLTGRAGFEVQDLGVATDDWLTDADTVAGAAPTAAWHLVTASVVWSVDAEEVDHDDMLRIGPLADAVRRDQLEDAGGVRVLVTTDLPTLSHRVAEGSEQGRTTVVVLVAQLLVLVAVVLWMVLVAATDDRRPELALARLRGRGRRGAAAYLLAELLPLTLAGVVVGILAAPLVMAVVARAVFPVPVPTEHPTGYLLAALGSVVAVLLVVLGAARRAVTEPVDSLLRAVPARARSRTGVTEVVLVVFSLTAVLALATGNLEGPLATLAPTLLAVAVGLLLARGLAPVTTAVARRLLRSGRAVAAAGVVAAVRRPAARRVLVMTVVASALLVFCVDALVTGQHNRQNAAEQQNGAPYSQVIQSADAAAVVAALEAADPGHEHVTAVVTTGSSGNEGPTVAVDSTAFPRVAFVPTGGSGDRPWGAIAAPDVAPLRMEGETLAGTLDVSRVSMSGPSRDRFDDAVVQLQVQLADGVTHTLDVAHVPAADAAVPISVAVPCADGCTVTGLTLQTPPGLEVSATLVPSGLTVDGQPFSLGAADEWRPASSPGGTLRPATDAEGNLGAVVATAGSTPPVMVSAWVPDPVPALVTTPEDELFRGAGLEGPIDLRVAGTLTRVPGSPEGARVVDLGGLLRRADTSVVNVVLRVWADDPDVLERADEELRARGVYVGAVTSVDDVRSGLDASPAAWSLALSVLVGGAALLVAMLVIVVATATTWRARATDLAALRMAGLPDRSLRRLELLGQLPVVAVGALVGAACGVVAAVLALPGVRQFTEVPEVDTTDFSTPWAPVLVAAAVALLLLAVLAVATSRWTARRAPLNRIREVV